MEIRTLDLDDDKLLRRSHEIMWRAEKEDGRPWNAMWTYEEVAALVRQQTPERRTVAVAAWEQDQMVGVGWLMMSDLDNLDSAWCFAGVEPELRGRGIGNEVMDRLVTIARDQGRTKLTGSAAIPFEQRESSPILRWTEANGFGVANVELQRNLDLPADGAILDEIESEAEAHHDGYEIRTFVNGLPDELLESWCELAAQFVLEAPMGDLDFEAEVVTPETVRRNEELAASMGRTTYSSVALHDDTVVALSDLIVPRAGDEAHQFGTLVHRDHRGHRLGAAVKVANLRRLEERQPEVPVIVTTNAETNAWMVAINDRLGFRPIAVVPAFKRTL